MIPNYTAVHNKFKLNDYHYTHKTLKEVAYSFVKEGDAYEKQFGDFLLDWLDAHDTIKVKTSGSTSKPKTIELSKQAMVNSALATGDYFKLKPGDSALLCLPTNYIAGKMMVVRAIILGLKLDLLPPSSNPLEFVNKTYHFAAMVPMQVKHSLNRLSQVKILIVGGAKVSDELVKEIQISNSSIYATYGMTETVTHIAVKKLNKRETNSPEAFFEVLPNIKISQDDRSCLVINAPYLGNSSIITNDVVKLHSKTSFELLGRIDNVINSGGVKIHPEQVEENLSSFIKADFFITSRESDILGEELILVVEGEEQELLKGAFKKLQKHEIPKDILFINTFKRTSSGKVNRTKTLDLLKGLVD